MKTTTKNPMGLGWTIEGPVSEVVDGVEAFVIRVAEFPGFLVVEDSREAALNELHPALVAWIASYVEEGEPLPPPRQALRVSFIDREPGATAAIAKQKPAPGGTSRVGSLVFAQPA